MVIAMTKGYSEQTAGAKLCIDLASDWAGKCLAEKALNKNCSFDISCWEFDRFLTTK